MSSLSAVIFALVLATGLAAPAGNGTGNKVEDLIEAYLGYVKEASAEVGIIELKKVHKIPIISIVPPVAILLTAENGTLSGNGDFTVSNVSAVNNTARYTMQFSDIKMQSDYEAAGVFYGRPLSGQGHAQVDMSMTADVTVTFCNVNGTGPLHNTSSLQIAELSQSVSLDGVSSNFTGLNVEGMSPQEVETLLNAQINTVFTLNLPIWSKLQSEYMKIQLNSAMEGKTIDDAINWLKNSTTPEPSVLHSFIKISSF